MIKSQIINLIKSEGFAPGNLSIIFCSDEFLLEVNRKHLSHDYYTDIVTFDYSQENTISGDLLISIPRVKENAGKYRESFTNELLRVIVHGILHLCGYNDKSRSDQSLMRTKETFYLASYFG